MSSQSALALAFWGAGGGATAGLGGVPPDSATIMPRARPRAIGTASGRISCLPDRAAGRFRAACQVRAPDQVRAAGRRRGRRRAFPLQVFIASTSVHSVYLEGDARPVPAFIGAKARKFFCRI